MLMVVLILEKALLAMVAMVLQHLLLVHLTLMVEVAVAVMEITREPQEELQVLAELVVAVEAV
jgi:hypothetical protein